LLIEFAWLAIAIAIFGISLPKVVIAIASRANSMGSELN